MQKVSYSKEELKWTGDISTKVKGGYAPVTAIYARDNKWGIGKDNGLPWEIADFKEDMDRFRQKTVGNTVIMGRKCYESIGRNLPRRHNIVISTTMKKPGKGVYLVRSPEEALALANSFGKEIFILGGGQIYEAFEELVGYNKIYETEIKKNFKCDVKMKLDLSRHQLLREDEYENKEGVKFYIREYFRI